MFRPPSREECPAHWSALKYEIFVEEYFSDEPVDDFMAIKPQIESFDYEYDENGILLQ